MMKKDIISELKKEPKTKQHIVIASLVVFISTFLPWLSISFFGQSVSTNAWNGIGYLTVLGSLVVVLSWILPALGIKFKIPMEEKMLNKVASCAMIIGPLSVIYDVRGEMSFIGIGLWVALVASVYAVYLSFKK